LRWALYEAAKNSSHQTQSRPPVLRQGQRPSRRQDRRDLDRASVHATLLPHSARSRSRGRVRHADLTLRAGDGAGRLFAHQGQLRSAPATGMLTSTRAGQPYNTDAIALPRGGHPNTIVVADDVRIVEHRGNPGRPHAATEPSRTLIQGASSSLRCKPTTLTDTKPNTTNPHPHAPKKRLDTQPRTGDARPRTSRLGYPGTPAQGRSRLRSFSTRSRCREPRTRC